MATQDATRIGYIGLDHHHADPFLETLATLPVEVTCGCLSPDSNADPEELPVGEDIPVYDSPGTLLDDEEVDVVWLTLPNRDTPRVIDAAVRQGVDVFTEKPGGRTAEDLRPVAEHVRCSDAVVCPAYVWRAHPVARTIRRHMENGFFGQTRMIHTRYIASKLQYRNSSHYIYDSDASRGGIIQWLGVHWIDLVPWMLGDEIEEVVATVFEQAESDVDIETGASLQYRTKSGAMGTLQCGYYHRDGRYDTSIRLYAEDGRCSWDPMGRTFGFDGETVLELEATTGTWSGAPARTITYDYEPQPGYGGSWGRGYVDQFLKARNGAGALPATLADAVEVLHVLDAAYESARSGEWVAIERSGEDTNP